MLITAQYSCVVLFILVVSSFTDDGYEIEVPHGESMGIELNEKLEIVSKLASAPLYITKVQPGDSIISVDGRKVSTMAQLRLAIATPSLNQAKTKPRRIYFRRGKPNQEPSSSMNDSTDTTVYTRNLSSWLGRLEVLRVGRASPRALTRQISRNALTADPIILSIEAKLAKFGGQTTTKVPHPFILIDEEHMGCEVRLLPKTLTGIEYLVVQRGRCSYAEKAIAAQSIGAAALIIIDTAITTQGEGRLEADAAYLKANPQLTIPIVSVSRQDGRLLREYVADSRNAQSRLNLRFNFSFHSNRTTTIYEPPMQREQTTAQAVRRAFRSNYAPSTKIHAVFEGLSLDLIGVEKKLNINVIAFGHTLLPATLKFSMLLFFGCRTVLDDDFSTKLSNIYYGVNVVLDLSDDCGFDLSLTKLVQELSPELIIIIFHSNYSSLLFPFDLDPYNLPENLNSSFYATMTPAAAKRLRSAFSDTEALQIQAVQPRPRLLRTWRQLLNLTEPSAWPSESKLQTRIYGSLRSLVQVPGGDEPDPDQWTALKSIWSDLQHVCEARR
uniref:PA domain-containing protein n=1 Tax=Aureoumbra lagunensis TaxID=44058 RepID=A0A7S3JYL7_9STRA